MPTPEEILAGLVNSMTGMDDATAYFKGIIYGPSGVGKTKTGLELAQAITPAGKDILYVDSAEGWVTLNNHPELKPRVKRMKWLGISQQDVLVMAIEAGKAPFNNVGCIVYDEYSSMADSDLDLVVTTRARLDASKSPDEPKLPDMGASGTRMRRLTQSLIPLDLHIIFIAHEREDKNDVGLTKSSASFMPKFGQSIKQVSHLVTRMTANEVQVDGQDVYRRTLQVQPSRLVDAKSRVGTIPGVIIEASEVPPLVAKWLGNGGKLAEEGQSVTLPDESPITTSDDDTFTGIEV